MLQAAVYGIMKQDENRHDFRIRHLAVAMVLALLCRATGYGIFFHLLCQKLC